jgi:TonB family protein
VHKTQPEYPKDARKHRVEGSVTLQARVTAEGTADEIKVLNGQATDVSFIPRFDEAAVAALGKWRYRPATIEGKPVPVYFTVTIDFMLSH